MSNIENGRSNPSNQVILGICRTYNVSEVWLRTGEGEMFLQLSRADEITQFVARTLRDENSEFQRRLLVVLSDLNSEQWQLLADMAQKLAEQANEDGTD